MTRPHVLTLAWLALATAATLAGCTGGDGPPRYELSGQVLYKGKPVPAGEVNLEPDSSQGNSGPGSIAPIEQGRYQTVDEMGVVGGAYIVRIMGFDGVPLLDSPMGSPLFPPYETKVDLPSESTTHDFDVPASVR